MPTSADLPVPGGLSGRHVWLIAAYGIRFALRTGGGLVFLLLLLISGLSVGSIFITPVESILGRPEFQGKEGVDTGEVLREIWEADAVGDAVQWATGVDDEGAAYLLKANPALLSAILIIMLWLVPFLACLGAFNQTAGDIGSRGLRYLLLRTERENIFFGRFLSVTLFALVSLLGLVVLLVIYIQFKLGVYSGGALWTWGLQGFIALTMLALPYIALCAWFSSLLDSAFASLAVCVLVSGFPLIFLGILENVLTGLAKVEVDWLDKLMPWGWKYGLLSGDFGERMLAYGMMLAFTALFLWLGLRHFKKRDL